MSPCYFHGRYKKPGPGSAGSRLATHLLPGSPDGTRRGRIGAASAGRRKSARPPSRGARRRRGAFVTSGCHYCVAVTAGVASHSLGGEIAGKCDLLTNVDWLGSTSSRSFYTWKLGRTFQLCACEPPSQRFLLCVCRSGSSVAVLTTQINDFVLSSDFGEFQID